MIESSKVEKYSIDERSSVFIFVGLTTDGKKFAYLLIVCYVDFD